MSRCSTALLTVGPRSLGPWGDRNWRVSGTCQLVEGSTPYWIVTPTQPAEHQVTPSEFEVVVPYPSAVVESVLLLLGANFGDDAVEGYLIDTHNITVSAGRREVARYPELSDEGVRLLSEHLAPSLRLAFTLLDDLCLIDDEVISMLRELGFDVDVFLLDRSSGAAAG